ncbi:hypothetical protein [Halomonas korlensis]|uniref:Uncharacterized protein n=1 Tax=Halomonas korlensis TaxID=463301 RepID=A0A1I7JMG9_9GAMM|nr:hypothetical protein [Halomonas korlensis]SFU86338.1 hypothetical protein SAMN04487955_11172 [Halomonas korlensis]
MSDWLYEAGMRRFQRATQLYRYAFELEQDNYWFDAKFVQGVAHISYAIGKHLGWLANLIGGGR